MAQFKEKFQTLTKQSIDEQEAFFLHRFVFRLGEERYFEVKRLKVKFVDALKNDDGKADSMSPAVAADFFQKNGQTRTAMQRKAELADVDVNQDGRTSFIEYMLLTYKIMILQEFFDRKGEAPDVDMDNNGVGLTGVGERLIEELFAPPQGVDPELEKMMKAFAEGQAQKQKQISELEELVAAGGVKGMSAKSSLDNLLKQDQADLHAIEARISAAIKKADKKSSEECARLEQLAIDRKDADNASRKGGMAAAATFSH
jgi:polyhydroxyalkanoate synthesis regulator phasin